jgi:amidase
MRAFEEMTNPRLEPDPSDSPVVYDQPVRSREVEELGTWDAVETSARLRRREVSRREVVDAALARAEACADLGAVAALCAERARSRAGAQTSHDPPGALSGVPTFIKDLTQVEGVETTWGSQSAAGHVSRKSDPIARRMEAIGLNILGKSAASEFGITPTTEPVGRAPCRNPWNRAHSTGGSSGGAAALVASGVVPIAHASDGGGSIRIPASACGLVGHKPSRFVMDMDGSALLPVNIAVDGVLTRTVRDTVAYFEAVEPTLPASRRAPQLGRVARGGKRLRMGVFTDSPLGRPVARAPKDAAIAAGELCASLGHRVESIAVPFEAAALDDFLAYWGFLAWIQIRSAPIMLTRRFDARRVESLTSGLARTFTRAPLEAARATARLRRFAAAYAKVFERLDVLITPTMACLPPELGWISTEAGFDAWFERVKTYVPFTPLQNAAGAPAISLPLGRADNGLPIGVQFAGRFGDDAMLLSLALELEEAAPWRRLAAAA